MAPLRPSTPEQESLINPRTSRSRVDGERPEGQLALWLLSSLFLVFLLLPLAALLLAAPPAGPLGRLHDPQVLQALHLSLVTSSIATVLAAALGTPVAYLLARYRFRGQVVLDTLIDLPMTLPPVVAGLALLLAFGRTGLLGPLLTSRGIEIGFSTAAVVIAQAFMATPFFIRAARAGFEAVPVGLEHAAMTLGRGRWGVFWSVTTPLAAPALFAGAVLAWARALSEFGATLLFAGSLPGKTQTLPLAVMSAFESDLSLAIATAVVSLALAFGALVGARLVARVWSPT